MSTLDHKRAFRAPTDNDGGFFIHPNALDDLTLSDGTPGLQRIVATNTASAIGPYIVRGLDIVGTTLQAGEAMFKSGGIVSVVAKTLAAIGGSGNFLYLDNAGNVTREGSAVHDDTKLLIDYYYSDAWVCTREDSMKACLGHKNLDVIDGTIAVKDTTGSGKETTIDSASGVSADAATITALTATTMAATTGHITTLDGAMAANSNNITGVGTISATTGTLTNLNATTLQGNIVGNSKNIATLGNLAAATATITSLTLAGDLAMGSNKITGLAAPAATTDAVNVASIQTTSFVVMPFFGGYAFESSDREPLAPLRNAGATPAIYTWGSSNNRTGSVTYAFVIPNDAAPGGAITIAAIDDNAAFVGTDLNGGWTLGAWYKKTTPVGSSTPTTASPGDWFVYNALTVTPGGTWAKPMKVTYKRIVS
jgi:hypothetical protein